MPLLLRRLIPLAMVSVLSMIGHTNAQDNGVTFPPDAADIFPPYVTVIDQSVVGLGNRSSNITFDNDNRLIAMEDDTETRSFPYPDAFVEIRIISLADDGQTLMITAGVGDQDAYYPPYALYELDLASGAFSLFEFCAGTIVRASGHGGFFSMPQRIFVIDPQANSAHLCDLDTGEISVPLPIDNIGGAFGWRSILTAPSEDWLLLIAGSDPGGRYAFFGYDLSTGSVVSLGLVGGQSFLGGFDGWLNDSEFVFEIRASIDGRSGIYRGDVRQPDSFELVIPGEAEHLSDAVYETFHNFAECGVDQFDLQTDERTTYVLGSHCQEVFRVGINTYVALVSDSDSARNLVWQDSSDAAPETLYEGEIERLYNVSPDGRYIVWLADDNGRIDDTDDRDFDSNQLQGLRVVFYDAITQVIMYSDDYAGWRAPFYGRVDVDVVSATRIHPINEGVSWLSSDVALLQRRSDHVLLTFENGRLLDSVAVDDVHNAYPGGGQLILHDGDESDARTYQLYDVASGERRPLFAPDFRTDDYVVSLFGHDPIRVRVLPRNPLPDQAAASAIYVIEIVMD